MTKSWRFTLDQPVYFSFDTSHDNWFEIHGTCIYSVALCYSFYDYVDIEIVLGQLKKLRKQLLK